MNYKPYGIRRGTDPALFDQFAAMMAVSDPWKTLGMDAAVCRAGFDGAAKLVLIAWNGDEPAGVAIVQVGGTFNGYIQTLFVAEAFRGGGLGRQLLAYCEGHIIKTSPNIFICVSSFNTRALRLYQEAGFILIGTLKDFLAPGFDELLLRKTIGPKLGYQK